MIAAPPLPCSLSALQESAFSAEPENVYWAQSEYYVRQSEHFLASMTCRRAYDDFLCLQHDAAHTEL